jgi:hypothetical protein
MESWRLSAFHRLTAGIKLGPPLQQFGLPGELRAADEVTTASRQKTATAQASVDLCGRPQQNSKTSRPRWMSPFESAIALRER